MRGGRNPVLAHLFLQHMLDTKMAETNFSYIGYQPPQRSLDTHRLVAQGYVPENLSQAVVQEEWFDVGYRLLELSEASREDHGNALSNVVDHQNAPVLVLVRVEVLAE